MPNKGDCLPGDQNVAGLCYSVPSGWGVTSPGFIGQLCDKTRFATNDTWDPTTYVDQATDSTDAKTANAATRGYSFRDDGTSCWIDVDTIGRGTGYAAGCPSGMYKAGSLCYTNCPTGWKGVAGVCWPDPACPAGTTDSGVSCTKNSFMQAVKGSNTSCPNGWRNDGTSCWEDVSCKTEWNSCSWKTLWGSCVGGLETRCSGCGCIKQGVDRTCDAGYSLSGLLCYQNCPSGYTSVAGVCWPQCGDTSKWTDTGVACAKKSSVPAPVGGVVPSVCNQTNGYNDDLAAGICYPNCTGFAQKSGKPFWKNYHGTTVNFCQRDARAKSKNVKSAIGNLPYDSSYYPTSDIANLSFITPDVLASTKINEVYSSPIGCLPNIDASKLAPGTGGTALAIANQYEFNTKFPNNGEFSFGMSSAKCGLCPTAYGKECESSLISGIRPGVKRVAYNADPLDCCNTGSKLSSDGKTTCDPQYWSSEPNRIGNCYIAKSTGTSSAAAKGMYMDDICNDPAQYPNNEFCKKNYTQLPTASDSPTEWTDWSKCPVECGGGIQSQTRTCNVTPDGANSLYGMRNTILALPNPSTGSMTNHGFLTDNVSTSKRGYASGTPDSDYFIVNDECAGQPLENTQACNTQNCITYEIENNRLVQLLILLVVVYFIYRYMSKGSSAPTSESAPAYTPAETAPSAPPM